ncbi:MAG: hypothetical protein NW205_13560 [Hyphomicrobiaceae bacterium]|nr:hypothetical protein [Hyphomicrobiaceae bacterium]
MAVSATQAHAQAMSPMRGEVKSFTDEFVVRVFPANPYPHRIRVEVKVYDETFAPVPARVAPGEVMLAPEDNRGVLVVVPFEGRTERKVRICTESIPFTNTPTRLRTQVCGRFIAYRLG